MALVVVLALAGLLTAATAAVISIASTDVRIAAGFRWARQLEHAAEAGLHRALVDLKALPEWTTVLSGTSRSRFVDGSPSGVRTVAGGAFVDVDVEVALAGCGRVAPCSDADRTAIVQARPWGPNNPRWRPFAYGPLHALAGTAGAAPVYLLVLVGDDPREIDGNPDVDETPPGSGAGIIRLRALAFGPAGSRRAIEATVARVGGGAGVRLLDWQSGG
ncbi:MAG: hypothetical protein FJW27_10435 [Acidimicrobiia bacterium]|nr:hypothetical protein [Acidimicrobiia bacterium]